MNPDDIVTVIKTTWSNKFKDTSKPSFDYVTNFLSICYRSSLYLLIRSWFFSSLLSLFVLPVIFPSNHAPDLQRKFLFKHTPLFQQHAALNSSNIFITTHSKDTAKYFFEYFSHFLLIWKITMVFQGEDNRISINRRKKEPLLNY